jgi:hypothetical protein
VNLQFYLRKSALSRLDKRQIKEGVMIKRISRIAPLQCGIVLMALYGFLSLIAVPFILIGVLVSPNSHNNAGAGILVGLAILVPIMYAVLGFLAGVISAAIYNLVAKLTGGIEFTVTDAIMSV